LENNSIKTYLVQGGRFFLLLCNPFFLPPHDAVPANNTPIKNNAKNLFIDIKV